MTRASAAAISVCGWRPIHRAWRLLSKFSRSTGQRRCGVSANALRSTVPGTLWHRATGAWRLRTTALVVATILLSGCSWFTDFKHQPKIDPWESPSDTIAFRGNPQNSVSIYGSAAPGFLYDRMAAPPAITAMAAIPNPTPPDSASVHRGKLQYQINCAICHGPSGMGNGNATKYGMPGIGTGVGSNA